MDILLVGMVLFPNIFEDVLSNAQIFLLLLFQLQLFPLLNSLHLLTTLASLVVHIRLESGVHRRMLGCMAETSRIRCLVIPVKMHARLLLVWDKV